MPIVEQDIEVDAPVSDVYQRWTQYGRFPEFMSNIEEVRRLDGGRTHWTAKAAGQTIEWDARTLEENDRRVAWTAEGESGQSGEVRFERLGAARTRIHVRMDYTLDNRLQQAAASALKIDDAIVARDLGQFKDMIERDHSE